MNLDKNMNILLCKGWGFAIQEKRKWGNSRKGLLKHTQWDYNTLLDKYACNFYNRGIDKSKKEMELSEVYTSWKKCVLTKSSKQCI